MSDASIDSRAYLDQILSFGFCDKRLELRCREGVDQTSLGDNEEENLGTGQD